VKKQPGVNATGRFLQNNLIMQQITSTGPHKGFDFYSSMRLNRTRSEMFSVNLARRLLRTTRTLVLPAYTNISLIANSYDVVHSWFIPGLGLKIDCVPGKSTHHSLYIDNVGLYYGQCAEICGRYHHHMPIRVCALPFEHFLVWWTSKGLPKSLRMRYDSKLVDETLLTKYRW
jgi:heme/copper-type cytochrome/quinol oxidase subunit 2